MKVVLFCGGLGMRLRELSEDLPKPMVRIGPYPILWHVMKYYAHFGHRDFILCLGYKADAIRNYFLNGETRSGDNDDWRMTFVDTGLDANVGQRLRAVRPHVEGEEMFLANYADGLTDLDLPKMIATFRDSGKTGCCLCTRPYQSFHVIRLGEANLVRDIRGADQSNVLINGGYFIFRQEIFEYIRDGEDLAVEAFRRLSLEKQLLGYPYDRFWCMDTFKEHCELTQVYESGNAPWEIWRTDKVNAGPVGVRQAHPIIE